MASITTFKKTASSKQPIDQANASFQHSIESCLVIPMRAPIISGIIKIKALGEALFQEILDTYASPETWQQARALLDACPRQHTLCKERYVYWTENAGLGQ